MRGRAAHAAYVAWIAVLLIAYAALEVEAARDTPAARRRQKRNNRTNHDSFQRWYSVVKYVYLAVIIPLGAYLLYAFLKDPITPHLVKELWYRLQERVTGCKIVVQDDGSVRKVAAGEELPVEDGPAAAAPPRPTRTRPRLPTMRKRPGM